MLEALAEPACLPAIWLSSLLLVIILMFQMNVAITFEIH